MASIDRRIETLERRLDRLEDDVRNLQAAQHRLHELHVSHLIDPAPHQMASKAEIPAATVADTLP